MEPFPTDTICPINGIIAFVIISILIKIFINNTVNTRTTGIM